MCPGFIFLAEWFATFSVKRTLFAPSTKQREKNHCTRRGVVGGRMDDGWEM